MAGTVAFIGGASGTGSIVNVSEDNPLPVTGLDVTLGNINLTEVADIAIKTGAGTASGAIRVELPTDGTGLVGVAGVSNTSYETVAAGVTAQVLGGSGAIGDYLVGLLVIPATVAPGLVTLIDNATSIPVYAGTAAYDAGLVPFFIPIGAKSASGAWKVTTGLNVSVIGIGKFT